jgi:CheY-like chemotaxis protein
MNDNILIVDSSDAHRTALAETLQAENILFDQTADGFNALNLLKKKSFSAIILDHSIPGMKGVEFIREIRKIQEKIFIMILSRPLEDSDVPNAIEAGADDYIIKPIDPLILLSKLKVAISNIDIRTLPVCFIDPYKDSSKVQMPLFAIILELSEEGMVFQTDYMVNKGSIFTIESEIFKEMQMPCPKLRSENCETIQVFNRTKYVLKSFYYEISCEELGKIRKWILIKNLK